MRIFFTLKAFEIVASMKSKTNPPDNVPTIPQITVTPPNIKSAFSCKAKRIKTSSLFYNTYGNENLLVIYYHLVYVITSLWTPIRICA